MPQVIPFVVTAITTVTSAVAAAGPLAVAAFNAANIIGAGLLANEAFKAVQPEVKSSSAAREWSADPNAPNRFAFGRVGGAGNLIHNATYGPDKMFVGFVGVMSASGPIKGWVAFKADDAFVSFDPAGKAIDTQYANVMWLNRQRGAQPEAAYLASPSGLKNGAAMPSWGASYKLSGKAAYHYTLAENSKRSAYKGKVPTGIHYIEGLYCYDPRFDSSYPGGAGPCRIDDPTTWVYSTNAYIHGLNWNIGRWEGPATGFTPTRYGVPYASMKVGGIGARPEGIDFAAYVEAANVFDENGWACAAWPDADQGKGAVLDSFLQAGGGIYAERQGKMSCLHRAAPRASIVTITADDTAGTIEYDTTTSLLERINTIRPEYWSEVHGWQMVATDEVTSSVWREEDGQGVEVTKSKGLAYNYVPQSKQARELAALQIAHTREGIRGTAPLRHYLDLDVGDCFTFQVPEAILNGQKCIVLNVDPDLENDIINVTFASESDGKYPFAFGQTDRPPPAPGLQPADNSVSPPLPEDWVIVPRPPAPDGTQVPGFDLTGIVSNATATAVIVEWGLPPDPPPPDPIPEAPEGERQPVWADWVSWTQVYQGPPNVERIPIDGLQPGQIYYVAVRNQRGQNFSERGVWGPYVAPALIAGGLSPESPDWDEIRAVGGTAAAEAETRLQAALDAAKSQLEAADAMTASALLAADTRLTDALNGKASNATVTALQSQADGLSAWRVTADQVLTDLPNNYASASSVTGLQSEVTAARSGSPNLLARLTADRQVVTDGLAGKASASDLTALTSRMTTAEGVNTAQNTRLNTVETDLAGKASSTALATLSSEVTGARNGSATLGAQLTSMRQTVVDGLAGKAASSDLTNLTATVTSQGTTISGHSTRLTTVEGELVGKASASSVSDLTTEARAKNKVFVQSSQPTATQINDIWINPSDGQRTYVWRNADGWQEFRDARVGPLQTITTTLSASVGGLQTSVSDLQTGKASASDLASITTRVTSVEGVNTAQNTRLNTAESDILGKASAASVASLTSRVGTAEATLTTVGSTAADAQSKLAEARFALIANASGGNPARFGLVSNQHGSSLALDANQIWFGPNTYFDKATWTLRTTVGAMRYVQAWGPPFGGTDSLTYWRGPSSVADGAERKNNVGNGAWEDSTGDSFFGGSTLTGFFSTTAAPAAIVLGTGWTDVASFEIPTRQGWFAMFSGLDVRGSGQWLVPKEPEWPNAPEPRVDVRAVSTDPGGGDVIELAISQVTGSLVNTTWVNSVWSAHRIASNARTGRRRLVLQARRAADTAIERTTYAEARNGMMQAYYMLGTAPGTGSVPPTPPAGQQLVGVTEDPSIYLTVPI